MTLTSRITQHYQLPGLLDRIHADMKRLGKTEETVTPDDLVNLDEYHFRGAAATQELIQLLSAGQGDNILDLGSGLGGPARRLARSSGCKVTAIDLTEEYTNTSTVINRWFGQSDQIQCVTGDITNLSGFDNASFDGAWSIHVGMNIENKTKFYSEVYRVLKPGAKFIIYDVLKTADDAVITYPAPWASSADESFLVTESELISLLEAASFEIEQNIDHTPETVEFIKARVQPLAQAATPPPLSLATVIGPVFKDAFKNIVTAIHSGNVRLSTTLCRKP
ncbi:MAG: class I SAM-dependent methyltransferase [Methyloligellaceae bacterium]